MQARIATTIPKKLLWPLSKKSPALRPDNAKYPAGYLTVHKVTIRPPVYHLYGAPLPLKQYRPSNVGGRIAQVQECIIALEVTYCISIAFRLLCFIFVTSQCYVTDH